MSRKHVIVCVFIILCHLIFSPEYLLAQVHADFKDKPASELVEYLKHKGTTEAGYAAEALIEKGQPAVPELIKALDDGDIAAVLPVLVKIKDRRAIAPILKKINDPTWETANMAKGALREYGNAAVPSLVAALKDPIYFDAAIDVLKDIAPDEDSLVLLRSLLKSDDNNQRAGAAFVLGVWKDRSSSSYIRHLLNDEDPNVRAKALYGYEALHQDEPSNYDREILLRLAEDPVPAIRKQAVSMLRRTPGDITPTLISLAMKERDSDVRHLLMEALGDTGDQSVVKTLIEVLNTEKDQEVLSGAVYSLGTLRSTESVPYILNLFKRMSVGLELQGACIGALSKIDQPVDVKIFLDYLAREKPHGMWPLLNLIDRMAVPGDERLVAALQEFKPKSETPEMAAKINAIIERIKQKPGK